MIKDLFLGFGQRGSKRGLFWSILGVLGVEIVDFGVCR